MMLAYRYSGQLLAEQAEGVIYAENIDDAYALTKKMGLKGETVFSLPETLRSFFPGNHDSELIRFYNTLGRRIMAGRDIMSGLKSALAFIHDNRLRTKVFIIYTRMADGTALSSAMTEAGFPNQQASVIKAAERGGKIGEALVRMAEDMKRSMRLRGSFKSMARMPQFMLYGAFIIIFMALWKRAPMDKRFADEFAPGAIEETGFGWYFNFATMIENNPLLWALVFAGVAAGIFFFTRSGAFRALLDKWPSYLTLSERIDQTACWTSYGMLYDAGVPSSEAAKIVAESAQREDTQDYFIRMNKLLLTGMSESEAVRRSGFPNYIKDGIAAAQEGDASLPEGINRMTSDLDEDVTVIMEIMKFKVMVVSTIFGGFVIVGIVLASMYPIMKIQASLL